MVTVVWESHDGKRRVACSTDRLDHMKDNLHLYEDNNYVDLYHYHNASQVRNNFHNQSRQAFVQHTQPAPQAEKLQQSAAGA